VITTVMLPVHVGISIDAPSDRKMKGNFIQYFPGEKNTSYNLENTV
jgi:hypothetical protein